MAVVIGSNVPDYRGRFLRHVGGQSAALGGGQEDAGRNVTGMFGHGENGFCRFVYGAMYAAALNTSGKTANFYGANAEPGFPRAVGIDASRQWGSGHVAGEFRPSNVAVKWLVFAGD